MTKRVEPVFKTWTKPELQRIEAGSAESGGAKKGDGKGQKSLTS